MVPLSRKLSPPFFISSPPNWRVPRPRQRLRRKYQTARSPSFDFFHPPLPPPPSFSTDKHRESRTARSYNSALVRLFTGLVAALEFTTSHVHLSILLLSGISPSCYLPFSQYHRATRRTIPANDERITLAAIEIRPTPRYTEELLIIFPRDDTPISAGDTFLGRIQLKGRNEKETGPRRRNEPSRTELHRRVPT